MDVLVIVQCSFGIFIFHNVVPISAIPNPITCQLYCKDNESRAIINQGIASTQVQLPQSINFSREDKKCHKKCHLQ